MKKYIVITSIFKPTKAVTEFSKYKEYDLVVVGDKKSPANWYHANTKYISVDEQVKDHSALSKFLPFNHYCRKMLGYLFAIRNGADIIIDTDDDNLPKTSWKFPKINGDFNVYSDDPGFINIYSYYTNQNIWPRGIPLDQIHRGVNELKITKKYVKIGVWQALADEDPDVDAIYRLTTNNAQCVFNDNEPIVLEKNSVCPFNSQNTLIRKELFPLLYLPTYVTFRFTDILRGIVAQPIMWEFDYLLGFQNSTVIQDRNEHDYFEDFLSEIPMYKYSAKVLEIAKTVVSKDTTVSDNLFNVYKALYYNNIVDKKELFTLEAWLRDISTIN
jgi:hypothetical protein